MNDDAPVDDHVALPLPMFPLGTVLVPFAPLTLHVFEERYRVLMRDCAKGTGQFGVVLIERGFEVGGGDTRFGVGTVARIVESVEFPDGRWALVATGTRRVKINVWLPDDPYPVALVEDLPDPTLAGASDLLLETERVVRRTLALAAELAEPAVDSTVQLPDSPHERAWLLIAVSPIASLDKQRLLEEDDPVRRLEGLHDAAAEAAAVFAYRLGGG